MAKNDYTNKIVEALNYAIKALEKSGESLTYQTCGYDLANSSVHAIANEVNYFLHKPKLAKKLHAVAGQPFYTESVPDNASALIVLREALREIVG